MTDKIIDKMIEEKEDWKSYKELAEETTDMDMKEMLCNIAKQEEMHFNMLKEHLGKMLRED